MDFTAKLVHDTQLIFVGDHSYENGAIYRGQMLKNGEEMIRQGYGVQIWPDGTKYEGYWNQNRAQGKGCFWHAEGDIYRGEFHDDKAQGFGIYTHANGSRYEGQWVNDL